MPLDRTVTPPGGWQFYQPETRWQMPAPVHQTWASAVNLIQQHRLANPVLSSKSSTPTVEADLEAYTLRRLDRPKPVETPHAEPNKPRCRTCGGR